MGKYSQIPHSTFEDLQLDAGILLNKFDFETGTFENEDIICPTTDGLEITLEPEYIDFGEDIDNCPENTKELKKLDSWTATMEFTSIGVSKEQIRLAVGCADIEGNEVVPRTEVRDSDFQTIYWVGDRMGGGVVAVEFKNALSTGGFSLETNKKEKGQLEIEMTAHTSIKELNEVPVAFYTNTLTGEEEESNPVEE